MNYHGRIRLYIDPRYPGATYIPELGELANLFDCLSYELTHVCLHALVCPPLSDGSIFKVLTSFPVPKGKTTVAPLNDRVAR